MFRRCPVCGKVVYDDPTTYEQMFTEGDEEETSEFEIRDDTYKATDPKIRTEVLLNNHILAYHPTEGAFFGVVPLNPRGEQVGRPQR